MRRRRLGRTISTTSYDWPPRAREAPAQHHAPRSTPPQLETKRARALVHRNARLFTRAFRSRRGPRVTFSAAATTTAARGDACGDAAAGLDDLTCDAVARPFRPLCRCRRGEGASDAEDRREQGNRWGQTWPHQSPGTHEDSHRGCDDRRQPADLEIRHSPPEPHRNIINRQPVNIVIISGWIRNNTLQSRVHGI